MMHVGQQMAAEEKLQRATLGQTLQGLFQPFSGTSEFFPHALFFLYSYSALKRHFKSDACFKYTV